MQKFFKKRYYKPHRRLVNRKIDYLKLGTKFAWLYNEKEGPSITNQEVYIFRTAVEYFGCNPSSSQVKATYNAWTKDIGGARSYAMKLRQKSTNIHKLDDKQRIQNHLVERSGHTVSKDSIELEEDVSDLECNDEMDGTNHVSLNSKDSEACLESDLISIYSSFDLTNKDKVVSKMKSLSIFGKDLKTLEYPPMNDSYSLQKPGEVNDTIILAYLHLIKETLASQSILLEVYDMNFFPRLSKILDKTNSPKEVIS
ncbi:hypothetical protein AC249_AIPGENE5011 [Exaiptasia diaphana]|nr:hypothetical protein AC249_AIPGENE5011 [Exaiptasia diaphana]